MASTTRKKSTTTKKSGGSSARSGSRSRQPQKRPVRREVGGAVLLVVALCAAVSYFGVQAIFLNWLALVLKGLFGYGYWLSFPALLMASLILLLHRGRPVRLRVTCALLLPLLTGALGHMLLAKEAYEPGFGVLKALWTDGVALHSGGAVSGSLAVGFVAVFSKYAALPIFALLLVIALMIALRLTPAALWEKLRERPQYEPEPEPEPAKTPAIRLSAPEPVRRSEPERPKPQIDFPLDDAPAAGSSGEDLTPPEQEKKEG